jgi:hypothetical protein
MRKFLLSAVILLISFYTEAQTKGTNALGLGFTSRQTKDEFNSDNSFSNRKANYASLTYGRFVKDNIRLGLTLSYSYDELRQTDRYNQTAKGYGAGVNYQKYYPLFKKLYAVAGGKGSFFYSKNEDSFGSLASYKQNHYSLGVYGSAAYFLSKRFALEATVLSADIAYTRIDHANDDRKHSESNFNLSSSGVINNLGFQIYFLF